MCWQRCTLSVGTANACTVVQGSCGVGAIWEKARGTILCEKRQRQMFIPEVQAWGFPQCVEVIDGGHIRA